MISANVNLTPDDTPACGALIGEQREGQVFWHLRARTTAATLGRMFTTARLRLSLVVSLSLFFWVGLYVLFYNGFRMLSLMHTDIVQPLYNAFFVALMMMLVFSSGIILYSSLFCSAETAFLLTLPARTQRIYAHKFQEAVWFSSWGFVLLGSPTLVAYGVAAEAPWHYFALLLPFIIAFVHIPAAIGGILCMLVVNRLPGVRVHVLGVGLLLLLIAFIWFGVSMLSGPDHGDVMTGPWFQELFARLRFTEQRLLPSWWLSVGLLEATRGPSLATSGDQPWAQSLLFLSLLIANAMFFNLLGTWIAGKLYRGSYSRLSGEHTARRQMSTWWLDNAIVRGVVFLPRDLRLLLVKDFRLFRRDPVQWSQFFIFFGLLGLYFFNIRRFSYNETYSTMIGFLNLAVVGLILSTFTTRFIFPMISLEGRQLWILGLLPIRRDAILWSKFLFASIGALIPCSVLILLSDLMLKISTSLVWIHQVSCLALCIGLSAIAVGLGAKMPDLRESSPSKIAAGFGGTLNLVISAGYIVVVVLLTALPQHLLLAARSDSSLITPHPLFEFLGSPAGLLCGVGLTLGIAVIATVWPLWVGLKAFRELEV